MATENAHITLKLDIGPELMALRKASGELNKLAATRPRSFMRAVRGGMRLQRALDDLARRAHRPNTQAHA